MHPTFTAFIIQLKFLIRAKNLWITGKAFYKMKKFTLIELLIVIAIIGILVSMLIPALRKARDASYQSVSKSNLSQIYKQFMIHVDDNDDQLPGIQRLDGSDWLYWRDYLEDSWGGREAASRTLLIPGQSYPEGAGYSYSPSMTFFRKRW